MTNQILTQAELKRQLHYNPDTGLFTRNIKSGRRVKIGDIAGWLDKSIGYIRISVNGKLHYAHRLAWLYMAGEFPKYTIDHINGNRSDNRICNLRDVTKSNNNQNIKIQKNNTSGFLGVSWCKERKKWIATISLDNKKKRIGRFFSKEEAYMAYLNAKKLHHQFQNLDRLVLR